MKKLFIFFFVFLIIVFNTAVYSSSGDKKERILVSGKARSYLIHIPPAYNARKALPLVIVLHGGGGSAEQVAKMTNFSAKADEADFIVVYPNGTGKLRNRLLTWNAGNCCGYALEHDIDDVGFIRVLIERLKKKYAIDSSRIYITGISNGAMMAYKLACELSDKIAAVAPVSGAMNLKNPKPKYPVSVVIFHGTADEQVLYAGGEPKKNWEKRKRIDNSVLNAVNFWVKHDKCADFPKEENRGNIKHEVYSGGMEGTAVEVYTIKGGTHSWPGGLKAWEGAAEPTQEISATDVIWDFFNRHPKD